MPNLRVASCNRCDFETNVSSGSQLYVLDGDGNKVVCPHPVEHYKIAEVLGISKSDAFSWIQEDFKSLSADTKSKVDESVGINLQMVCLDCIEENFLDNKIQMKCSKCGSSNLAFVSDLVGKPCPKCERGTIEKISKGRS